MPANTKLPVTTLTIIGLAVIVSASPTLSRWLVWDRTAIADGQWWRLATGHLVHFTPQHLGFDAFAVGVAGWLIESRARRSWVLLSLVAALAIGISALAFCRMVQVYGGLSGLACALCGYLAVLGVHTGGRARWFGLALLAVSACKVGWEMSTGQPLFISDSCESYVVLPLAHATGLAVGLVAGVAAPNQLTNANLRGSLFERP